MQTSLWDVLESFKARSHGEGEERHQLRRVSRREVPAPTHQTLSSPVRCNFSCDTCTAYLLLTRCDYLNRRAHPLGHQPQRRKETPANPGSSSLVRFHEETSAAAPASFLASPERQPSSVRTLQLWQRVSSALRHNVVSLRKQLSFIWLIKKKKKNLITRLSCQVFFYISLFFMKYVCLVLNKSVSSWSCWITLQSRATLFFCYVKKHILIIVFVLVE